MALSRSSSLLSIVALAAIAAAVGCSSLDPVSAEKEPNAPGGKALASDDPSCNVDSDCASGETCQDHVCQMQRCGTQPYDSVAPLGVRHTFSLDREIGVISDDDAQHSLEGYEPTDGSFAHPGDLTISLSGKRIVDAAGGNLSGSRPEAVAVALDGDASLAIVTGKVQTSLALDFVPVAVATGDVDADGTDEVIALGAQGDVDVCTVASGKCRRSYIDGVTGKDLTVADVDGDGFAEAIAVVDVPGAKSSVVVMNFDAAKTGQPEQVRVASDATFTRVAAGGVLSTSANEMVPTILALEDGGYVGFGSDKIHFFGLSGGKLTESTKTDIAKDAVDVMLEDVDGDEKPEVLVLEESGLEVYRAEDATLTTVSKTPLTASTKASRLMAADLDGDSPVGTLTNATPDLVPGPVIPMSVLVYPPYSRTHSDGTGSIAIGNSESQSTLDATTVTLKASLAIGFEVDIPDVVRVAIGARVEGSVATTNAKGQSLSIGDKFSVDARPDLEGPDNGVAVLACACYHAYTYKVEDPAGRLGAKGVDGRLMSVFVPVGGQTSLWSLKRYNALAAKVGNLPTVEVPYVVGDPDSYPKKMEKLDGSKLQPEDLLFTTPRDYRVSDVARVGWSLEMTETQSRTQASTIGVSLRGQLRVGPVSVEADVGASKTSAYTVTVGRQASFSGSVPPVRDDIHTPEDENQLYGYGFSPVVYRAGYTTKNGVDGGYYVMTYTVDH